MDRSDEEQSCLMEGELAELIENEWYIIRHSGETPEIAYNSAFYHLTRAQDGPHVKLNGQQVGLLKEAAVTRYKEIVLRDLQHDNSALPSYRGIARSIINFKRFSTFCSRQHLKTAKVRNLAAKAFQDFLEIEIEQLQSGNRSSIINCTYAELKSYATLLGVELEGWADVLEKFCPLTP